MNPTRLSVSGRSFLGGMLFLSMSCGLASATTFISNLADGTAGTTGSSFDSMFGTLSSGATFTTGLNAVNLNSITVGGAAGGSPSTMTLYLNNSGQLGTALTVLNPMDAGSDSVYSTNSGYALAANTSYIWMVNVTGPSNGQVNMNETSSTTVTGDPNWAIGHLVQSQNGGSLNTDPTYVPQFAIDGTIASIPETSSALLGSIAVLGLLRRRRA